MKEGIITLIISEFCLALYVIAMFIMSFDGFLWTLLLFSQTVFIGWATTQLSYYLGNNVRAK